MPPAPVRFSRAEEADAFARARAGDREAADLIALSVAGLVRKFANQAAAHYPAAEYSELVAAGHLAVARALPLFLPAKGWRWTTYVGTAVRREMQKVGVAAAARAAHFPRDPDEPDPDAVAPAPRALPRGAAAAADRVRAGLARLDPLSAALVAGAYGIDRPGGRGVPVPRLARTLGLSPRRARGLLAAALSDLAADPGLQLTGEG
jgi:hypothetical protein